jgi:hypothetical protein
MILENLACRKAIKPRKKVENRRSTVYRCTNGTPDQNLRKLVELMGGVNAIIGPDDIVLIKPNVQWWNQGATNLLALKTLVELIMERPAGFRGEVIVTENVHRGSRPWESDYSGWPRRFERNSDAEDTHNMNGLSSYLKNKYDKRFTIYHLIDVEYGCPRVAGPSLGTGYVYCDGTDAVPLISCENGRPGRDFRATIMTYPIMTTDKGTIVDFKNGVWEKGGYTGQPLKFINFASLNHHSTYSGATSSIKNYLGLTDMSGGHNPHTGGKLTKEYYNFHAFAFDEWKPGPTPGMIGAEVGAFMKGIRRADLNITAAEWVGLASRTEPPVAHTKAMLASIDPVALDYHAFKYILFPNSGLSVHNPDYKKSPVSQYLGECAGKGGGTLDEAYVEVMSYDFGLNRMQRDDELSVLGKKEWGGNPRMILKYLALRHLKS